jgi:hypothetical protein
MSHLQTCVDLLEIPYKCNFGECTRNYGEKNSFRKHLLSHESQRLRNDDNTPVYNEPASPDATNSEEQQCPSFPAVIDESSIEFYKKATLKFIIDLYGDVNMSRKRAQEIIDCNCQMNLQMLRLLASVVKEFGDEHIAVKLVQSLLDFFESPFWSSEFKLLQELEKYGLFIRPQQITIHIESSEHFYMHMIPLSDVFFQLFQKKGFLQSIIDYIGTFDQTVIKNVMQTEFWKNKVKFLNDTNTIFLPILIYFDDLEVLNSLGSHSGMYKLGATYVQLACLPEHLQSSVKLIFLALLFFTDDRKKFGNQRIFQYLIDQLNGLFDDGVAVQHARYEKVKFVPILVIGDNLGVHQLLGFVEGFNATYYCRFCILSKKDAKTGKIPMDSDLRNVSNYETQLALNDTKKTGLTEWSVFNNLKTYHVITNPSVDVMHDIQEGVCHYILCQIILQFINEDEYFSLDMINHLISIFNYGPVNMNKPNLITMHMLVSNKLKNSASEMMSFCIYLPLMIGHLVEKQSPYWKLFLCLRLVMKTVFNREYPLGTPEFAHSLIKELIERYVGCFGPTVPPKLHWLLHYRIVMNNVGPLMNISCHRFETKHQQFMKIGKHLHCRKNFTASLSIKHQLVVAAYLQDDNLVEENILYGPLNQIDIENKGKFIVTSNLNLNGKILKKNVVVKIDLNDDFLPIFGLIRHVIKDDAIKCFQIYCQVLETKGFNEHYCSFEVDHLEHFVFKNIADICLDQISSVCLNALAQKMVVWK